MASVVVSDSASECLKVAINEGLGGVAVDAIGASLLKAVAQRFVMADALNGGSD